MSKVDWSLAPEGATHYSDGNSSRSTYPAWWRPSQEASNKYECWAIGTDFWYETWQKGPFNLPSVAVKRAWSGPEDGLPPVGTVCELSERVLLADSETSDWFEAGTKVEVGGHAIFDGATGPVCVICVVDENFTGTITEGCLGPANTAEQLAAEQRETAIADMAKVLPGAKSECYTFNDDGSVRPCAHIHDVLGLLVDAGFKRELV